MNNAIYLVIFRFKCLPSSDLTELPLCGYQRHFEIISFVEFFGLFLRNVSHEA